MTTGPAISISALTPQSLDSARRFCRRVHLFPFCIIAPINPPLTNDNCPTIPHKRLSAPNASIALGDFVAEFTSFTSVLLPLLSLKNRPKSSFSHQNVLKSSIIHAFRCDYRCNLFAIKRVIRCYYMCSPMRIYCIMLEIYKI